MKSLIRKYRISLACLAVGSFCACSTPKVDDEVKKSQEDCPIDIGKVGEITSVVQGDTAVIFTLQVNEDSVTFDSSLVTKARTEGFVRAMLRAKKNKPRRLLAAMVAQEKTLQYLYVGSKSGKTLRSVILGSRLVQIVDENGRAIADPDRKIRLATTDSINKRIVEANKQLPRQLRQGLLLESIKIEGGYIVYLLTLYGTGLPIKKVKENPEAVKADVLPRLPSLSEFPKLCKPACLGLILRFRAPRSKKSDKKVRYHIEGILVTPDEFSKLKI